MADSFFGFDTNLESETLDDGLATDEEDEDYDALNEETFGEDVLAGDWEEDHEKLAELTELSRHGLKPEVRHTPQSSIISKSKKPLMTIKFCPMDSNGDLSSQIAAFVLDDEPLSKHPCESLDSLKPKTRPPPGFWINNNVQPEVKPILPALIKDVRTVEEIERNLIKPPPPNSLRLEDLEKKLKSSVSSQKVNPPGFHVRSGPCFSNVTIQPPRPPSAMGGPIPKLPPFHQFQAHPPLRPLPMSPNVMGLRGGLAHLQQGVSSLFMRMPHSVGPGRGPIYPQSRPPPEDEYAGLMTIREKHWLASIQMMQLSTTTPFQDDYYFLMYQQRQSGHHGRKVGCPLKVARDSQCLIKPIYTPLQFENSLGKLQIGSVTAPRKIIDTDIVESVECTSTTTNSKKVKQILLEIERMFSDVLLAEEALSPMGNHSSDDLDPNQLFSKTVNILLKYDKLKTVLSIRKGKTLVLRVLSHLEVSRPLAHKVITILPSIAKKDTDQVMLSALPAIRHFLASATLEMLVDLSKYLESDLPFLLSNKLGISVLANMIERAEGQWAQVSEEGSSNWLEFVGKMVSTCQTTENIERPVVGIQGPVLSAHLARCPSTNNQHIAILHRALSTMNPKVEKL